MTGGTWPQVQPLREAIAEAERQVAALYGQRGDVIAAMVAAGLTRREIGAAWGISNVAVTHQINKRGGTARVIDSKGSK